MFIVEYAVPRVPTASTTKYFFSFFSFVSRWPFVNLNIEPIILCLNSESFALCTYFANSAEMHSALRMRNVPSDERTGEDGKHRVPKKNVILSLRRAERARITGVKIQTSTNDDHHITFYYCIPGEKCLALPDTRIQNEIENDYSVFSCVRFFPRRCSIHCVCCLVFIWTRRIRVSVARGPVDAVCCHTDAIFTS